MKKPRSSQFVCLLVLVIGILQCLATQFSAVALEAKSLSSHVLFLSYIGVFTNSLLLPVHAICVALRRKKTSNTENEQQHHQETPQDQEQEGSTLHYILQLILLFFFYVAANTCYSVALASGLLLPSVVASIFSSCPVFVVALSWLMIDITPRRLHYISVFFAVVGVLLAFSPWNEEKQIKSLDKSDNNNETFDDTMITTTATSSNNNTTTNSSSSSIGVVSLSVAIVCAIISPAAAALYKVYFSLSFPNKKWYEAGKILGHLSFVNVFLGTALYFSVVVGFKLEVPFYSSSSSGSSLFSDVSTKDACFYVIGTLCSLLFNLVLNWGVTQIAPIYVSIGTVLSTIFNVIADAVVTKRGVPSWTSWIGIVSITASFIFIGLAARESKEEEKDKEKSEEEKLERQEEQEGDDVVSHRSSKHHQPLSSSSSQKDQEQQLLSGYQVCKGDEDDEERQEKDLYDDDETERDRKRESSEKKKGNLNLAQC